jgi:hypothetical protein
LTTLDPGTQHGQSKSPILQCGCGEELEDEVWLELKLLEELLEIALEFIKLEDDESETSELESVDILDNILEKLLEESELLRMFELESVVRSGEEEELVLELELKICSGLDDIEDKLLIGIEEDTELSEELELGKIAALKEEELVIILLELLGIIELELDGATKLDDLEDDEVLEELNEELEDTIGGAIILTSKVKIVLSFGKAVADRLAAANLDEAKTGTNVVTGISVLE